MSDERGSTGDHLVGQLCETLSNKDADIVASKYVEYIFGCQLFDIPSHRCALLFCLLPEDVIDYKCAAWTIITEESDLFCMVQKRHRSDYYKHNIETDILVCVRIYYDDADYTRYATAASLIPRNYENSTIKKDLFNDRRCNICFRPKCDKYCSACKTVYYCSTKHQKTDWPDHKENCISRTSRK